MRVYEIALPATLPDGSPCEGKHFAFQSLCLQEAGGYTIRPDGDGAWYNPQDGQTYYDRMRPYRIACEQLVMSRLLDAAFHIWQEEKAIFVTEIGEAMIVPRVCHTRVSLEGEAHAS